MPYSENAVVGMHSDQWLPLASAATAAALTAYAFYRRYFRTRPERIKGIPTPKASYPYVGHFFSLTDRPVRQLMKWHEELGPIIHIKMGVKPWVVISDPYIAHEILVTKGNVTSARPHQTIATRLQSLHGRGLVFSPPNKKWRQVRTVASIVLGAQNTERYSKILDQEADDLLSLLATGENIDPSVPLLRASLNAILITCFGKRTESINDPLFQKLIELSKTGMSFSSFKANICTYLPIFSIFDTINSTEHRLRRFLEQERNPYYRQLILETMKRNDACVLKSLADLKTMGQLDDNDILVTAYDLVTAGTDTTATTLCWAFAILCCYPDVQQKIQDEIDVFTAKHGRLPTFSERQSFPYMISVQKECMRYRPTTPFGVLHETEQDVQWRGCFIPKGTAIVSNMYAMHHSPSVYYNPNAFIPDRFLKKTTPMAASANAKVRQRDHFNFGWGRRMCPGAHLAEMQMFSIFVRVFSKYTIRPALGKNGEPLPIDLEEAVSDNIIVAPVPYQIRFILRSNFIPSMITTGITV